MTEDEQTVSDFEEAKKRGEQLERQGGIFLDDQLDEEFIYLSVWKVLGLMVLAAAILWALLGVPGCASAEEINPQAIADAIYIAEGGAKTSHPYGILAHYKHTTPRQACINTINHAIKDWNGKEDFIDFLGNRYAPLNVSNDPTNLNRNWKKNVRFYLAKRGAK